MAERTRPGLPSGESPAEAQWEWLCPLGGGDVSGSPEESQQGEEASRGQIPGAPSPALRCDIHGKCWLLTGLCRLWARGQLKVQMCWACLH